MHKNFKGPYWIGRMGERGDETAKPHRHNDGAMIVMGRDEDGDPAPVLHIPMRANAKRGAAWSTTDPDQEAFAEAFVALMNASARESG